MKRHTSKWKHAQFAELKELIAKYPIIALADLSGFPASLFQEVRKKLKGKAVIKVSKVRIVKKALGESKLKDSKLTGFAEKTSVAIIFTEMNPFELFGFLKKNKGSMPAKAGMIAPFDLIVPAGDTGLPPGPALSDLKAAGIASRIAGSTIMVPDDTVVAKKGVIVSQAVANALGKLDIKPIKVGLNLIAVVEGKEVFLAEVLNIDSEMVFENFKNAHLNAFNLAMNIEYFTKETMKLFVQKAFFEAINLSYNSEIFNEETVKKFLAQANLQAVALKEKVKAPVEEKTEEKAVEKQETEEKKEEINAEKTVEKTEKEGK